MSARLILDEEKKGLFLAELAQNGGIVSDAATTVGVGRSTLYEARATDEEFKKSWEVAADIGLDLLEDEAKRRALDGIEEPVFYRGKVCKERITRKSDTLLMFMLRGHRAKYRERREVTGLDGGPIQARVVYHMPDNGRGDSELEASDSQPDGEESSP